MADSVRQRNIYGSGAANYSGLTAACAAQGNEYGYSYYWWYYGVDTRGCHALEKRS
jgi:hypothetical protein